MLFTVIKWHMSNINFKIYDISDDIHCNKMTDELDEF